MSIKKGERARSKVATRADSSANKEECLRDCFRREKEKEEDKRVELVVREDQVSETAARVANTSR